MNVFQVLQTLSYGDAVSNDVLTIDKILRNNNFKTCIFAEYFKDRKIKKFVKPINKLNDNIKLDDMVIYHYCIGSELTYWFKDLKCKKILIYHNITPHKYFLKYNPNMAELAWFGRQSLCDLIDSVDCVLADSEYNKKELLDLGFRNVHVLPIIINFEDYKNVSNSRIVDKYKDGKKNILFVGRMAPNKRQEDLILAFDYYKKNIESNSRLILVGSDSVPVYADRVRLLSNQLGLKDVIFAGHVTFEELIGYYRIADVFLCMSEHEGFCVPLIECMYFGVPIIALGTTAIPDTLGDSGIIFYKKDFARIGELIDIVLYSDDLSKELIKRQKIRLQNYSNKKLEKKLIEYIINL